MTRTENDPQQTNELMAEKHPFSVIGPFYTQEVVSDWLGVDNRLLNNLIDANEIIAGLTRDGKLAFPVWQFEDKVGIKEWVGKIVPVLARDIDDHWSVALWLSAPVSYLGGQSAVQWLDAGEDIEPVLIEARHSAAIWRS